MEKNRKFKVFITAILVMIMIMQSVVYAAPEENINQVVMPEPVSHYSLENDAIDSQGNVNGTVRNNVIFNGDYAYLSGGTATSNAAYIEIPADEIVGKDSLTISVWMRDELTKANYAALYLGVPAQSGVNPSKYWILCPSMISNGQMKSAITIDGGKSNPWQNEVGFASNEGYNGDANRNNSVETDNNWRMYTTVITEGSISAYYDGEYIGTVDTYGTKISDLGSNLVMYVGKSGYGDQYYKGAVKDLSIYDEALDAEQIDSLFNNAIGGIAEIEAEEFKLDIDLELITDDLDLPAYAGRFPITWSSDSPEVLTNSGALVNDSNHEEKTVILTASIETAGKVFEKKFTVSVGEYEQPEVSLFAHYPLKQDGKDISGNHNDAELKGTGADYGSGYLYLPGGKSTDDAGHVELPKGMFDGEDTLTISIWLKNDTGAGNYAAMFIGTEPNTYNDTRPLYYWLLNPGVSSNGSRFKSVITNSRKENTPYDTERGIAGSNGSQTVQGPITDSEWGLYTTVITSNSISGYYNNQYIGTVNTDISIAGFGNDLVAYIGKSSYTGDIFYQGGVKELKVYAGAMNYKQVKRLYYEEVTQSIAETLDLGDENDIREDLILRENASFRNETYDIQWESSNPSVVSDEGVITRTASDETVTMTASVMFDGRYTTERKFELLIPAVDEKKDTQDALDKIKLPSVIYEDLELPEAGKYYTDLSWTSKTPEVISDSGELIGQPIIGEGNIQITFEVTARLNGENSTKLITAEVSEETYGYLMSYITTTESGGINDKTASLHLAYSRDGINWSPLNANSGILFAKIPTNNGSTKLDTGISFSNPYLFRKADGGFGFLSNKTAGGADIYLFDSKDLITYQNERLVATSAYTEYHPMEPEVAYDIQSGEYRILWKDSDTSYYNVTSDFITASMAIEDTQNAYEGRADFSGMDLPEKAVPGNVIGLTKTEFDGVVNKFEYLYNTGVQELEAAAVKLNDDEIELPQFVTMEYNDGSTYDMPVIWDEDQVKAINTKEEGVYEITGTVSPTEYPNPLAIERADPNIFYDDDTGNYYFTASYPAYNSADNGYDRINLRKASSIIGLGDDNQEYEEITIWKAPQSGAMSRHVWAPEIHKINGKWYVFFAAGRLEGNDSIWAIRPYVLVCDGDDPYEDTWSEVYRCTSEDSAYFDNMSLDMTYFEHNDRHYVIWADIIGQSALYMQEIDPDKPWEGKGEVILLTTPDLAWERDDERVNEGATILKNEETRTIYMAFSGSGTGEAYCIGLMYASFDADLMDPASWTKMNYPVLTSADVDNEYGPGHNSFTVDEYGQPIFVYHARPGSCTCVDSVNGNCGYPGNNPLYNPCRHARVKRVHWSADGTPILNMTYEQEVAAEFETVTLKVSVTDGEKGDTDKTWLQITVDYANEIKDNISAHIIPEILQMFKDALSHAEYVLGNPSATQEEVDEADEALITIIQYLSFTADYGSLKDAIDHAQSQVDSGLYVNDEAMEKLQDVLLAATQMYEAKDVTDTEIGQMISALALAEAELNPIGLNVSRLQYEITQSKRLVDNLYLYYQNEAEIFKTALANAETVLNKALAGEVTQEDVNQAAATLREARLELRLIPDKGLLAELIDQYSSYSAADYTAQSYAIFETALAYAIIVYDNPNAADEDITAAMEGLLAAAADLVPIGETENPDPGDGETDPESEETEPRDEETDSGNEETESEIKETESDNKKDGNGGQETEESDTNVSRASGKGKGAKTGDQSTTAIWLMFALASISAILFWNKKTVKNKK